MSNSFKDIVGYEAGRGKTFTPTVGASWINDFLQTMKDSKKSRNEVTEILIKEALDARKGLGSNIEHLNLNQRELEFIMTPVGRKIVSDYSQAYYGVQIYQDTTNDFPKSNIQEPQILSTNEVHSTVMEKKVFVREPISTDEPIVPDILTEQDNIKNRILKELEGLSLKKTNSPQ